MQFKSWTDKGERTDYPNFLNFSKFLLLNLISKTYHSAFGYNLSEVIADNLCMIQHDIIENYEPDDELMALNVKLASKLAKKTLLNHKTIIVRLDDEKNVTNWTEKPSKVSKTWFRDKEFSEKEYWYDFPEDDFISKGNGKTLKLVGPLKDCEYIHVVDLFEKIRLSSEDKGSRLSIDDVLFACRGLCADDTRSFESFNVLSDDGSTLVLKANIDNWST